MGIKITIAAEKDKALLYAMNKQLMEDEQFDRPLDDEALSKRWDEFLSKPEYLVLLFTEETSIAGYAIVEVQKKPLYLRHFFISRDFRRQGLGTRCFHSLCEYLNTSQMDLDVMSWNTRGYEFWKSLGFTERCRLMTLDMKS